MAYSEWDRSWDESPVAGADRVFGLRAYSLRHRPYVRIPDERRFTIHGRIMTSLVWTSDKPAKAGWYWWRGLGEDMDPLILYVDEVGYFQWPDGASQEVGLTKGEWAGPIAPPSED